MNRTQALTQFRRILQETEDWLSYGYRRIHDDSERTLLSAENVSSKEIKSHLSDILTEDISRPDEICPEERVRFETQETSAGLAHIGDEISRCNNCNLYLTRYNTVPGVGTQGAMMMIITPPPVSGAKFDSSPLSREENDYLGKWLKALGLNLQRDAFITPGVKCRTPGSRPPHSEESVACSVYLHKQYDAVQPHAVLALGATACGSLTGNQADFPSLVGKEWTWNTVPALVLWTPSEVLSNPGRLRKPVWESLQRLKAACNALPGSQL